MSKERLTGRRAVWFGLLGTPVLLVAAITLIGVTAGSAGPSTTAGPVATSQVVGGPVRHVTELGNGTQTLAELKAYWSVPGRMANAIARPTPTTDHTSLPEGSVQSIPQTGPVGQLAMMRSDGTAVEGTAPTGQSANALTEPFHADVPFSRWQWFGRYLRNVPAGSPNMVISTVHKMFFSQGGGNFVCSSSSIGPDGVWTAGHCVHNGSGGPGAGFSTNVLFCPSYDSTQGGVNPTAGCWGAEELWTWCPQWCTNGDLDYDFGGSDASDNPVIGPQTGMIGNYTGFNGLAWNFGNVHWLAFGYPQGSPFNGGTIMTAASSLGYVDEATGGGDFSIAMGSDLTGGSSGGPWIWQFGRPSQPGGFNGRFLNGHNDWRHDNINTPELEEPEMNTPYFNTRACLMFEAINDVDLGNCP
jgi:hypothetical protein